MSHSASGALSHNARKDRKKKATNNSDSVDTSAIVEPADANKSDNAFADKKNIMWVLLSGAMALTFIVMLFLPNTGMGDGMMATYSSMLWCGFFGAALWRYYNANGWTGFAIGSVVGFILQVISQII